jgi:hypothetical protein
MAYRALRTTVLVVITTITFSISPSADAAGRSLTAGVNTILNGKGAPKSVLGIDGDFYIDTRSLLIYGPKTKGKWPAPQNIQGPTGPSGNDGRNGSDGKAITNSNVSSAVGPQGEKGEKGEKGDPGLPGVAGLPGAMGPAGPAGLPGATGAQGPSGSNGSNGATGATGATGAQGPAGPSEVSVATIPTITLGTSSAFSYATSDSFGSLLANKSYSFEIYLRGNSNLVDLVLGADLVSSGNQLTFTYVRSDFRYSTYSGVFTSYGFIFSGTIQVANADSSIQVRVIDGRGETGATALTLTGKAYITLMGAIR